MSESDDVFENTCGYDVQIRKYKRKRCYARYADEYVPVLELTSRTAIVLFRDDYVACVSKLYIYQKISVMDLSPRLLLKLKRRLLMTAHSPEVRLHTSISHGNISGALMTRIFPVCKDLG